MEHGTGSWARAVESGIDDGEPSASARLPAGIRILREIPYGDDPRQRFDAYLPGASVTGAPVTVSVGATASFAIGQLSITEQ